jgi:hypothetical protein
MSRPNPRRAVAALLAIAAVAVAFAGSTAAASADHGHVITLREASATPPLAFVDLGKPGPTAGDEVVISDGLTDAGGAAAGTLRQACTLIDAGPSPFASTYECATSLELADGTITASGPFDPAKAEQRAAITGGTGAFRAARGEIVIRAEADQFVVRL